MIRRAARRRSRIGGGAIGVDRGVERADPFERFAETILDRAVGGRESGGFPQQ